MILSRLRKSAVMLAVLGTGAVASAGTITHQAGPFTDATNIVNHDFVLPQFNDGGGALTLQSVTITLSSSVTSSVSGDIFNGTNKTQTFDYSADVTDAAVSLLPIGFAGPSASNSTPTLLSYDTGSQSLVAGDTFTLSPDTQTLLATASQTLFLGPDDLTPYIGAGSLTYRLNASANASDGLATDANLTENAVFKTLGSGTVTIVYSYTGVAVPLPTTLVSGTALLGLVLLAKARARHTQA